MATTTNYGWTTPNDTDLVKDGASAIRTLGSSIDTTVFANASAGIPKTLIDAKGDLIAGSAADTAARLAVGTNDQVLTADSAQATGLKWATPGGASANYTLLNAGGTALTGAATITVSSISGIEKLFIYIDDASAGASSSIILRINGDTGSNYVYGGGYGSSLATYNRDIFGNTGSSGTTSFPVGRISSVATSALNAGISINGGKATGGKEIQVSSGVFADGGNDSQNQNIKGVYKGSAVITSISLISGTGNFDSGTMYIYGSAN